MHTSGVVMFLKSREFCASVAESFREGRVAKKYLCIVDVAAATRPSPSFTVEAPIERHATIGILRQVGRSSPKSQEATTCFQVAAESSDGRTALLCVTPQTGRTHQIRLHAQHCGLPIVGDDLYGTERHSYTSIEHVRECANDPAKALFANGEPLRAGLKLHAWQIAVKHPVSGDCVQFCAPPPQRFLDLADAKGLNIPAADLYSSKAGA